MCSHSLPCRCCKRCLDFNLYSHIVQQEAGTFTEDMTKNTKQPGEGSGPDEDPDYIPGQE